MPNALAYYGTELITTVKSFASQVVVKIFEEQIKTTFCIFFLFLFFFIFGQPSFPER